MKPLTKVLLCWLVTLIATLSVACQSSQESSAKDIVSFAFAPSANPGLTTFVSAQISGTNITATVPFGTNVTALVATFSTTGESVSVNGTVQQSGALSPNDSVKGTPNDFTNPVPYTVTAIDGSTQTYTVTVQFGSGAAKDITSFTLQASSNAGLKNGVVGTIADATITMTVPFATDLTALVATFTTTGASVSVKGTKQTSGVTPNDFTNPVTYTVTALDGSTKDYTVTVNVAANTAKDITAYSFLAANNSGLTADVVGTINGTNIAVKVPFGTNVTALVATFATTGQSVAVGTAAQTSGTTANDFTSPVVYKVTAADGSTQSYTVTVTIAPSSAKDITAFSFTAAKNPSLSADVVGTITSTNIAVTVPYGTPVTALIATFTTTGKTVTVGATTQVSGTTANNFTSAVTYKVTAADSSTKSYTVTVTVALNPAKDITAFSFLMANNSGLTADVTGTITANNIALTVPVGTNVTALVATFTTTGASVAVGATPQTSDVTANDFTSPVTYTVKAADNSTKDYTVTVTGE